MMPLKQVANFESVPAVAKRLGRVPATTVVEKGLLFKRDKQGFEELARNGAELPARADAVPRAEHASAQYPAWFPVPMLPDGRVEPNEPLESPMIVDNSVRTLEPMCYTDARQHESGSEYAQDIYNYMRNREERLFPGGGCAHITSPTRSVLMNWLVRAAADFELKGETLSLAVANVDRFLSIMPMRRSRLQLLGMASLMIAAKFEEVTPPEVRELVAIAAGAYTQREVVKMERLMLKTLSFDIAAPTIHYFLQRFGEVSRAGDVALYLGQYLCELTYIEDDPCLQYLPSIVAGAALCLANYTLDIHPWGKDVVEYSGYDVFDLRDCIHSLHRSFCNAPGRVQQAVREKFQSPAFRGVADVKPKPTLPF